VLTTLLLLLSLPAAEAPAPVGVVSPMTEAVIENVIASTGKEAPGPYRLRNSQVWMQFDTPLLRLARKVAAARAAGELVATHLATPDVIVPELHLQAGPQVYGDKDVGIKQVVIARPDGSTVAPTSLTYNVEKAQSRHRHGIKLTGVQAVFPADALVPGARFRFTMKDGPDQLLAPEAGWFDEPR